MDGIPDRLLAIPWVDAREGVEYCGNPDMYLSILGMFAKGIEDKATQLEEALASDDIELFTIKVHALKSSSLTMGMADFSARAKELELAGKGGDVDLIREKFPRFVEDYRSMGPVLMEALEA